jgi:hypothetical protein
MTAAVIELLSQLVGSAASVADARALHTGGNSPNAVSPSPEHVPLSTTVFSPNKHMGRLQLELHTARPQPWLL